MLVGVEALGIDLAADGSTMATTAVVAPLELICEIFPVGLGKD